MEQLHYLSELKEIKTGDKDAVHQIFKNFTLFSLELDALFYVDADGEIVIDSTSDSIEPSYKRNLKDESYFDNDKSRDSLENMYIRMSDEVNFILFSEPVYNENEQFKGIVLGAVNLDKINELLKMTNLGITGETYIVNKNAELLLDVAHVDTDDNNVQEIHTSITDAIIHEESPPKIYNNTKGQQVLGHYSPIFNQLFYVIHEIKIDEVLKTHEKMVRTILMIGIGIIIVGFLLVSFILKDIQNSLANFTAAIQSVREGNYEYKMNRKLYENSSIEIQEAINVFDNMTETIRDNRQELIRLSEVDPLTGCYNRRTFMSHLTRDWQEAMDTEQVLSIAFIDIDYFKQLNDTCGHPAGDKVLIHLTGIVEEYIAKTSGTLYRYGGEEFVILFPHTDEETAYQYAETIRKKVEREEFNLESNTNVTVSIGVTSTIPTNLDGEKDFVQEADIALYEAKKTGRNQVYFKKMHI